MAEPERPSGGVATPVTVPAPTEFTKFNFRALYIRRDGPCSRELIVDGRPCDELGKRYVSDFPIYDGRGADASLVARFHGVTIKHGSADHQLVTIVFETERLKGSTLLTNGVITHGCDEWAIYGGSGVFVMAKGVIKRKYLADRSGGNTDEITMEAFCPVFGTHQPKMQGDSISISKIGLWGGPAVGSAQDITEQPKTLQSLAIRAGVAVDSIEFTYTDKYGQKRTAGRWGGLGGNVRKIDLGDTEYIKEVSGTYGTFEGAITLTSFRLVTSTRTWGPWGIENGTRFGITAPIGSSIVGFYGRATTRLVAAIGVYLRQL